jgi:hypothetical protein
MANLTGPYEQIKAQIKAQCTDIQFVSMWNQQVRDMAKSKEWQVPFPSAFIEFVRPEKIQILGNGWRIFEPLYVKVHIVQTFYNATNGIDFMEENPLVFDGLLQEVYASLFQFEPDGCVAMFPTQEEGDYDHDDVYHTIITFQTNYVDGSRNEPIGGIPWNTRPEPLDIILNPWEEGVMIQDNGGPLYVTSGAGDGYFLVL